MSGRRTILRGGLALSPAGQAALQDIPIEDGLILAIDAPGLAFRKAPR
jgi:hypothetical protein